MIVGTNIAVTMQGQQIIKSVSCDISKGRITVFIGKSGAGKTTLLKTLAGLIKPTRGRIVVDDKDLSALSSVQQAEHIGYVFQEFNLFAHLTVLQNCIDPLIVHGFSPQEATRMARACLEQLDMITYDNKYPCQISGGQQQRVAIARALCLQPKALLLDEPTASLDPINTQNLVIILNRLAAQGLAIGLSSQDMGFVRELFDHVYYMESGSILESCQGKDLLIKDSKIGKFLVG